MKKSPIKCIQDKIVSYVNQLYVAKRVCFFSLSVCWIKNELRTKVVKKCKKVALNYSFIA